MRAKTLPTLLIVMLLCACTALGSSGPTAGEQAPKIPGITKVGPGKKIKEIKSDPFTMGEVSIQGGVMKIKVTYAGGSKEHDFKLYWNGITARSYPPQTSLYLKHDANGDTAEALLTKTLQFDLAAMNKPMVITVRTDHGDKQKVTYGKP